MLGTLSTEPVRVRAKHYGYRTSPRPRAPQGWAVWYIPVPGVNHCIPQASETSAQSVTPSKARVDALPLRDFGNQKVSCRGGRVGVGARRHGDPTAMSQAVRGSSVDLRSAG